VRKVARCYGKQRAAADGAVRVADIGFAHHVCIDATSAMPAGKQVSRRSVDRAALGTAVERHRVANVLQQVELEDAQRGIVPHAARQRS